MSIPTMYLKNEVKSATEVSGVNGTPCIIQDAAFKYDGIKGCITLELRLGLEHAPEKIAPFEMTRNVGTSFLEMMQISAEYQTKRGDGRPLTIEKPYVYTILPQLRGQQVTAYANPLQTQITGISQSYDFPQFSTRSPASLQEEVTEADVAA